MRSFRSFLAASAAIALAVLPLRAPRRPWAIRLARMPSCLRSRATSRLTSTSRAPSSSSSFALGSRRRGPCRRTGRSRSLSIRRPLPRRCWCAARSAMSPESWLRPPCRFMPPSGATPGWCASLSPRERFLTLQPRGPPLRHASRARPPSGLGGRPVLRFARAVPVGRMLTWHDISRHPLVRRATWSRSPPPRELLIVSMKVLALENGVTGGHDHRAQPGSRRRISAPWSPMKTMSKSNFDLGLRARRRGSPRGPRRPCARDSLWPASERPARQHVR
jgi:hypothetical protein